VLLTLRLPIQHADIDLRSGARLHADRRNSVSDCTRSVLRKPCSC
jgi:hypothetical protein